MEPIKNFPGYWIDSKTKKVYSTWYKVIGGYKGEMAIDGKPKELKQFIVKGYWQVALSKDGKSYGKKIHRLLLETYKPIKDSEKYQAAHRDGNPLNNNLDNLYWATAKQNAADRERHGHTARGNKGGTAKLAEMAVKQMRLDSKNGASYRQLVRKYNMSKATVGKIINRQLWKHI